METPMLSLNFILNFFEKSFNVGRAAIHGDAIKLITVLFSIEIALAGLYLALGSNEGLLQAAKRVLFAGLLMFFINNYDTITHDVVGGFIYAGELAGSGKKDLPTFQNPDGIIERAFTLVKPGMVQLDESAKASWYGIPTVESMMIMICMIVTLVSLFLIAIQGFVTYLEFLLISSAGLILLPFGAFGPTRFLAEKTFAAVISFGIKLMVLGIIMGISAQVMDMLVVPEVVTLQTGFNCIVISLALCFLALHAPGVAAGLLHGQPSLTMGQVASSAQAGLSGAKSAAGAAMSVGSAAFGAGKLALAAATSGGAAVLGAAVGGAAEAISTPSSAGGRGDGQSKGGSASSSAAGKGKEGGSGMAGGKGAGASNSGFKPSSGNSQAGAGAAAQGQSLGGDKSASDGSVAQAAAQHGQKSDDAQDGQQGKGDSAGMGSHGDDASSGASESSQAAAGGETGSSAAADDGATGSSAQANAQSGDAGAVSACAGEGSAAGSSERGKLATGGRAAMGAVSGVARLGMSVGKGCLNSVVDAGRERISKAMAAPAAAYQRGLQLGGSFKASVNAYGSNKAA